MALTRESEGGLMDETVPAGRRGHPALRRLAELLALTGFAIAQPVLDVTGRSPDFFLYRRPSTNDMRLFVLLVAFAPPFLLWFAERAVGLVSKAAERALHVAVMAVLLGALAVQIGKHLNVVTGIPLAVVALAAGAALAVAMARSAKLRQVLFYAAPAPLVFLLTFTLATPAGVLVRPVRKSGSVGAVASKRPPIVFLLLDEFPARVLLDDKGEIDKRVFPNFARLAAGSTWYPNASAVIGTTPNAVPAILTGRYPKRVVAPSYIEYPENLFTLLAGTYDIDAFESVTQLCPPTTCDDIPAGHATGLRALLRDVTGVARDIESPYPKPPSSGEAFADGIDSAKKAGEGKQGTLEPDFMFGKNAKNNPERFTNFLAGLRPIAPEPSVHFLHILLPHVPYRRLPSGRTYAEPQTGFAVPSLIDNTVVDDPKVAAVGQQRIVLQTAYADMLLGKMLDRLEETGLWDKAMVVVTADHGVGLVPGARRRRLNEQSAPDVTNPPLFVRTPGQREGKVDRRNEQHVDLLPTIADVLDLTVPWAVDGVSLLGPARPDGPKPWYDYPGRPPTTYDPSTWTDARRRGVAPQIVQPQRGTRGLFAAGPLGDLVGRRVSDLTVGAPSPAGIRLAPGIDVGRVRPSSGAVPSMLWGDVDGTPASPSGWLAVAVNGTVAGCVPVVTGKDGRPHFLGLVDDTTFREGANDVTFYAVDGGTLHPLGRR
jgi:hypothetical protein